MYLCLILIQAAFGSQMKRQTISDQIKINKSCDMSRLSVFREENRKI